MTADWATTDYYGLLEVSPDVDPEELKRAYRRMAQKHHPDANPGDPQAPERFRLVAEAYAILSDSLQRSVYDRVQAKEYRGRTPEAPDFPTVEDLMAASGAILGRHVVTPLTVPLEHVAAGAPATIDVEGIEPITVDIPAGVEDGDIVRVEGAGRVEDDMRGDVIVIVHVPHHPLFTRRGDDVAVARVVNVSDLALGVTVQVLTPHGVAPLDVPPGTNPGAELVLEGYGIRYADEPWGDLLVRIDATSGGVSGGHSDKGTFSGVMDVLDGDDVEIIPTVGWPFDPELHEVVGKVAGSEGRLVITGEIRRGYRVRGQVIRPALVTAIRARELP